jgi:hypothetical protein
VREYEPAGRLLHSVQEYGSIHTLDIDRGYLSSPAVEELHRSGTLVQSRPWAPTNFGRFTKDDFRIDFRRKRVTCPSGKTAEIFDSERVEFAVDDCRRCKLKKDCTNAPARTIKIHPAEDLMIKLRQRKVTKAGRRELRKRVAVEHRLARVDATQGDTARYRGARKNELDLNRTAAVINLFEVARSRAA